MNPNHSTENLFTKDSKILFAPFRILSNTAEEQLDRGQSVAHQEANSLATPTLVPNYLHPVLKSVSRDCTNTSRARSVSRECPKTAHPELNPRAVSVPTCIPNSTKRVAAANFKSTSYGRKMQTIQQDAKSDA
jgi:hypothetical protein